MSNKRMSDAAVSVFCRNMAMMLSGGISPVEAVHLLGEDSVEEGFQEKMKTLQEKLILGEGFAVAIDSSAIVPPYACEMIKIGEQSGRTENVLYSLSDYYENRFELQQKFKSAVFYPMILLIVMCAVLALMVFKILPVFIQVYESLSGSILASSYAYVKVSMVIAIIALIITAICCFMIIFIMIRYKSEKGRKQLIKMLEKIKFSKKAMRKSGVLQLLESLNTDQAMEIASDAVDNDSVKKDAKLALDMMREGKSLSQAIYDTNILEPLYARMLISASHTGKLDSTLDSVTEITNNDMQNEIGMLVGTVEPILTGFLTVAIGICLISAMLPLTGIIASMEGSKVINTALVISNKRFRSESSSADLKLSLLSVKVKHHKGIIIVICFLAAVAAAIIIILGCRAIYNNILYSQTQQIKETVIKDCVQCYCSEGVYPSNLEYLEDNYGLIINHDKFIVSYEAFSSNVLPSVKVLVRGEESDD